MKVLPKFFCTAAICLAISVAIALWPADAPEAGIHIQLAEQVGSDGTNWTFGLHGGRRPILVDRENHSDIAWLSNGTTLTNYSQSGMTTTTIVLPGRTWNFNVKIPSNAVAVQVTVDGNVISNLQWRLFELSQQFPYLAPAKTLFSRFSKAEPCAIHSTWTRNGTQWTEQNSTIKTNFGHTSGH